MLNKRLNDKEIRQVMEKIRRKFEEYAGIYGEKIFSYDQFRNRYRNYLQTGGDLEIFLFAEIQALEDRKKEIEEQKEKRRRVQEAQEFLEQKGEELLQRIEKYPEVDLHSRARIEIRKLAGVFRVLYETLEHHLYDVSPDLKSPYRECLNRLKDVVLKPYTGEIARYIRELDNPFNSPSRIEILEQGIIKDWGIVFNTFISILQRVKGNAEVEELLEILRQISSDFRINIFKPLV